jgi:4-amino-4-deoxy-L-arabinose transferase-like glycosyltransferase
MRLLSLYPIILCWLSAYAFFRELGSRRLISRDWQLSWIFACLTWGALLTGMVELTSLAHIMTGPVFTVIWLVSGTIFLATALWLWQRRSGRPVGELIVESVKQALLAGRGRSFPFKDVMLFSPFLAICGMSAVVLALLYVAFTAAPNNWDSLTYHLPRIVHWLQNGSVAHYPTHIDRQVLSTPWAEFATMALYMLSDGDYYVAGVQWFSMVSSAIGVSLIAAQFSKERLAPLFGALIALAIPMGIMQATSTQNDYVTAFWLVCLFSLGLLLKREPGNRLYLVGVALALGLGVLTKPITYIFALPFMLWLAISLCRRHVLPLKTLISYGLLLIVIATLVNIGFLARNFALIHSPLVDAWGLVNESFGPGPLISNLARNIVLHAATGNEAITRVTNQFLVWLHATIGQDMNDPRTTYGDTQFIFNGENYPHENVAGNPIHLLGIVVVGFFCLRPSFLKLRRELVVYYLCLAGAFVLFCLYFKWQPWHSRLHLSLFVLYAPLLGIVLTENLPKWSLSGVAILCVLYAGYWTNCNQTRPFSVHFFQMPREEQYFLNLPQLSANYEELVETIASTGCHSIGLVIAENSWEYPLWALLKDRGYEARIEHVYVSNPTAAAPTQPFTPCLLVFIDADRPDLAAEVATEFPIEESYGTGRIRLLMKEGPPALIPRGLSRSVCPSTANRRCISCRISGHEPGVPWRLILRHTPHYSRNQMLKS